MSTIFVRGMKKSWWAEQRVWLGIICSAIFLFLVFRNVRWLELAAVLRTVDWAILLLAAALYALSLILRGLCWHALLAPLGSVTKKDAVAYANIGYMANNILPLRAGEVIRATLLGEKRSFSKSAVLATIVVERLLDILILGVLASFLMWVLPISPGIRRSLLLTASIGCLGIVAVWVTAGRSWTNLSEERLPRRLRGRVARLAVSLGKAFSRGLSAVRSGKQAGLAGFYSLLAWMLVCGSIYLMMLAAHLQLPWYSAVWALVVVNLGSAIPSSPGSIGVVHFLVVVAISPWGVSHDVAVGFSIVFHAVPFLVAIALGGACLWKEKIGMGWVNKRGLAAQ